MSTVTFAAIVVSAPVWPPGTSVLAAGGVANVEAGTLAAAGVYSDPTGPNRPLPGSVTCAGA